jgi:hypothetical protein
VNHAITNRRLRDGDRASNVSTTDDDLAKLSLPELLTLKEVVFDGAVALQSLDDLKTPELNDAAWLQCQELDRKLKRIKDEIATRGA